MFKEPPKLSRPATGDLYAIGTRHDVTVDRWDGQAAPLVDRPDGRPLRVPGGIPGDRLTVEITAHGRRESWTRIRALLTRSPDRVTPPCPIVRQCGACAWQAVSYPAQRRAKAEQLREALAKQGLDAPVSEPAAIDPPFGYRTKIQMPVAGRRHELQTGFWAPRSHRFVEVTGNCPVQHEHGERTRHAVLGHLNDIGIAAYDEQTQRGDLRSVLIRVAAGTGEVGLVLVIRSLSTGPNWRAVATTLMRIPGLSGVWANENAGTGNAVLGEKTVHLAGARALRDVIGGARFVRPPTAFFQTNHRATEQLVAVARDLLPERFDSLVDLYAGAGLFAVTLGDRARTIHLVESDAECALAARSSLDLNGLERAQVHVGATRDEAAKIAGPVDVAVLDPPRAGLHAMALEAVVTLQPRQILYVSCRPKSLTRDLARLTKRGFVLRRVVCVDMFPHTPHVEAIALLERAKAPTPPDADG